MHIYICFVKQIYPIPYLLKVGLNPLVYEVNYERPLNKI